MGTLQNLSNSVKDPPMTTIEELETEAGDQDNRPALKLRVNEFLKERFPELTSDLFRRVAGVSRAEFERLSSERFFIAVEPILRVALALDASVEAMFPSDLVEDLRDEIVGRRNYVLGGPRDYDT